MIGDIAFGQFIPGKSPLHRMDPRVKFTLMVVFMVSVFLAPAPWGLLPVAALVAAMVAFSNVPLKVIWQA